MKIYFYRLLVVTLLFLTPYALLQAAVVGFAEKPIWFSTDTWVEGETITISTLVVNTESSTLGAKVQFYDKTLVLGEKSVTVDPNDAKVVSLSWKVSIGEHSIYAKISGTTLTDAKGKKIVTSPTVAETDKDTFFVAKKISNTEVSASGETTASTDPLQKTIQFIENATPPKVAESVVGATTKLETTRLEFENSLEERKENEQLSIKTTDEANAERLKLKENADIETVVPNNYIDSSSANPLKKPISYILIFFYTLLLFIVGHAVIYYGLGALILFWVIRAIVRKVRK